MQIAVELRPLSDAVIVEPYGDPDKFGSLYIPPIAQNPESQQGRVLFAGKHSRYVKGDYLIYRQWQGEPFTFHRKDLLRLKDEHIVCAVDEVKRKLIPKPTQLIIVPDPEESGVVRRGNIYVPNRVFEQPWRRRGTIAACGEKCYLSEGQRIYLPNGGGFELGFIDTVYYVIDESDILATYDEQC